MLYRNVDNVIVFSEFISSVMPQMHAGIHSHTHFRSRVVLPKKTTMCLGFRYKYIYQGQAGGKHYNYILSCIGGKVTRLILRAIYIGLVREGIERIALKHP